MDELDVNQLPTSDLAMQLQKSQNYKKLGFCTAHGTEWFEFSPIKMKEYFYELGSNLASQALQDDISFTTVLDMSLLNIDSLEDGIFFETNLATILDRKAKEDARIGMLRRVCGHVYHKTEHEMLRNQVNRLVDADLLAAKIKYDTESDVLVKSSLMALHLERLNFTRNPRHPEEEFRITLYRLAKQQAGSLTTVQLYFPYNICFERFVSSLNHEIRIRKENGVITLDGHWKYSMLLDERIDGIWLDLHDKESFQDLLDQLSNTQGEVAMIHAVEDLIERKYQECNVEDKNEDNENGLEQHTNEELVLDANGNAFFSSSSFVEILKELQDRTRVSCI